MLQKKIERETEEMLHYSNEWAKLFLEEYSKLILVLPAFLDKRLHESRITLHSRESTTSTIANNSNKSHLTIRNNKIVYSLFKKGNRLSSSEADTFKEKLKRGKRGSKYRGVSRNGNQWQVLIMVNKKKKYMGNYSSEEEAARVYDYIAIQYHGRKAKTNFLYSNDEILTIIAKNEY